MTALLADIGTVEHRLARFERLVSSDLDEVRHQVGRVFCEHRLLVIDADQSLDTRLYFRPGRDIGLGRLRYGAAVDIDPGMLRTFFLLQMPLRGGETVHAGGDRVHSTPQLASIVSPSQGFRMQHSPHTEKLFIRVERAALERQFAQLHARAPRGPIEFVPGIDMTRGPGLMLQRFVDWLMAEASDGTLLDQPLIAARIEEALMTALLGTLPHNQPTPELTWPLSPRFVRRAQEYIEENAGQPLTAAMIAAHAGVSVRSLQAGFRSYRQSTPMAYVKAVRLDRVRAELQGCGTEVCNVTVCALRWGFSHLGMFAAAYRQRFGELPSQTRARAIR